MGCAHSGSTLLTSILARHSAIATVGELKGTGIRNPESYTCGCGDRFVDCAFWTQLEEHCSRSGIPFSRMHFGTNYSGTRWLDDIIIRTPVRNKVLETLRKTAFLCWLPVRRRLGELDQRNNAIMDAICSLTGKSVFLDGSKDPTRLTHFIRSGLFDVRPVYLVRDGRAIVASYKKRNPDIDYDIELWRSKATECERLYQQLPRGRVLKIRYEDFCTDPSGTLQLLLQFFELADESRSCLENKAETLHVLGHESRLDRVKHISFRQEWKSLLSTADVHRFQRVEGTLNRRHGYSAFDRLDAEGANTVASTRHAASA